MELKVIAYAHNGHTDKFGIPRQSREESPIVTRIVFEPEYSVREALRGIEGFSHLWILWGFHQDRCADRTQTALLTDSRPYTKDWSPTVRPPRLGGNKRMGVFATRSPFRPNPIGLSSVRLLGVKTQESGNKTLELIVSGADVLDGTPIYDIKPYLSFSDCHENAINGFAEDAKDYQLEVDWSGVSGLRLADDKQYCLGLVGNESEISPIDVRRDIEYILSQDPRPAYQDDPNREYKLDYAGYRVCFVVQDGQIIVKNIEKVPK